MDMVGRESLGRTGRRGGSAWGSPIREWSGLRLNRGRVYESLFLRASCPFPCLISRTMAIVRRRTVQISLCLLATLLVGTVVVLSTISYYLSIDAAAYLTELELDAPFNATTRWNATEHAKVERIPRIIHQTWKTDTIPSKWAEISQQCRDMMPDYEYMLWTDASSRDFIAEYYPWFLHTFDNYPYPIQRADAIRYFILYHYGGVYMDLDIGCLRPFDPLLVYPVLLPKTIPVGVSNDLIFSEARHPFMEQTMHGLIPFDHSWVLNYPTVMFSTGPMFLSAQYGIYTSSHPPTSALPGGELRILPKSLYGKNAKPGEAPHSFFSHFYGSSWHADDAAFIGFLGKWGKGLMWVGLVVFVLGVLRLVLAPSAKRRNYYKRIGGYEVVMPRWIQRNGRWHLDLGWFTLPASGTATQPTSPISLTSDSSTDEGEEPSMLPLFSTRSSSPALSESSLFSDGTSPPTTSRRMLDAVQRAGDRVRATLFSAGSEEETALRTRPRSRRGVMFFLPAFLAPQQDIELLRARSTSVLSHSQSHSRTRRSPSHSPVHLPPEKAQIEELLS
ncbi:hypothetical protein B0H21DRAFT_716901 [Amylocystis lapponica]|nr:hypothetical protein B0H21DRAFT_716901 [Amylocystis lapponica]